MPVEVLKFLHIGRGIYSSTNEVFLHCIELLLTLTSRMNLCQNFMKFYEGLNRQYLTQPRKCFPKNTVVTTKNNKTYLDELEDGDYVLAWDEDKLDFTRVWCKTHHIEDVRSQYLQIDTETKRLEISHRHFVLFKDGDKKDFKKAEDVKIGDVLYVLDVDQLKVNEEEVKAIEEVECEGVYNVFTDSGRIIANGIFCSVYSEVHPNLVHPMLAPLRAAHSIMPTVVMKKVMAPNSEGQPHVIKYGGDILKPVAKLL
ncbi:hypothetical protein LOTGIDRAFT_238755 [Lottia gigantea]|uniref:Hint domain-containing protein n=1 Tax=Lottia gigantea TaxID=225164 RepID=V4AR02_LOTGI|nr:hypothetical protein LOTGIDRAFT_238755 [Lottia gigantea]ESO99677.1 hypothetical protein LOTGIDRAFT_238755 [Lottia gigantea]